MALYIFSDVHLGADEPEREQLKLDKISRLLELVRTDGDRLIILGDLFDFWFEYRHAIPKDHHRIICELSRLVQQGIAVDYVSGNHDFWMGDFFECQVGLKLHRDVLDLDYDGLRLHLLHGDGLAKADRGYRFLKRVFRNRLSIWLYRMIPPDLGIPLAKRVSGSSRQYTAKRDHGFVEDYEQYAASKLQGAYDLVAIGHLHIPALTNFPDGTYINTGDFVHHFSYVRIANAKATLEYLR